MVIVFTGSGKGKTTAALGCALRASGHGMKTLIIQFMKKEGTSGEQKKSPVSKGAIDVYAFGAGFMLQGDDVKPHQQMAEKAWRFMEERLQKKKYDLLVLDELAVVLMHGLIPARKVMDFLARRDKTIHVIITGRGAPPEIIDIADIVTDMRQIKHVYQKSVLAIKGLDY